MGMALLRLGNTRQAIRFLEEARDSVENASRMIAEIYLNQGDLKKAAQVLDKIEGYPDSWTTILKARLAIAKGDKDISRALVTKALGQSQEIISNIPGEARGYINDAFSFMMDGKYDAAESELEVALFVDNRDFYQGETYLDLGRLFDLQGDHETAEKYYKQVIENNSGEYEKELAGEYIKKPFKLK
jgi:tetratricopeptide (TPR) repeat protein